MQKEVVLAAFLISIILLSNLAYAQSYSGFSKFKDNLRLFFASGDNKVRLALEIREKELNSAIDNAKLGNKEEAVKNLEDAKSKLRIVQEQTSSNIADEVKLNIDEVEKKIMESKNLDPEFQKYLEQHLTEEQKTQLTANLSEKLFSYCEELAKQDYDLMLKDEKCNPDNAPSWLKKDIDKKIKETQKQMADEMLNQLTTCMTNPKECDCSKIPVTSEQAKCEKAKAFMIRCEFQQDESACKQLEELGPPTMPSDMPSFLKPIFEKTMNDLINNKEKEMFNKLAPPECAQAKATTRGECEKIMMEKNAPRECIEAGATTKEACEKIMNGIYGPPPTECMQNGQFIGEEACDAKMVSSGNIPQECIKDRKPIPPEECNKMMQEKGGKPDLSTIPKECIKNGEAVPPEECMQIMKELGITPPGGTPGEMQGNIPQECMQNGQPIPPEECNKIMEEKGIQPPQQGTEGMLSGECREKGITDFYECQKIVNLPRPCKDKGIYSQEECGNTLMQENMPQECVDANALTPESCMKIMLPQECKDKGAFSREECEAIMLTKNMPQECQKEGKLTPEECGKILAKNIIEFSPDSELDFLNKKGISFDSIPSVCKSGSNFVRSMECDKALAEMGITLPPPADISNIPKECIKDGQAVSPQECQQILENKLVNENIPHNCREAGIESPEECGKLMEKQRREQGIGINMPSECMGKTPEECKVIMEEKGMRVERVERVDRICKEGKEGEECREVRGVEGQRIEKGERIERMPRECMDMEVSDSSSCDIIMSKINEERMKNGDKMIVTQEGEREYISNEQINKIAEQAEQRAEEIKPDLEQAQEIREEINIIEQNIQQIEQQQQISQPLLEQGQSPSEAGGQEVAGGGESASSEASTTGQASLILGNTIRNIQSASSVIQKAFEFIFKYF